MDVETDCLSHLLESWGLYPTSYVFNISWVVQGSVPLGVLGRAAGVFRCRVWKIILRFLWTPIQGTQLHLELFVVKLEMYLPLIYEREMRLHFTKRSKSEKSTRLQYTLYFPYWITANCVILQKCELRLCLIYYNVSHGLSGYYVTMDGYADIPITRRVSFLPAENIILCFTSFITAILLHSGSGHRLSLLGPQVD